MKEGGLLIFPPLEKVVFFLVFPYKSMAFITYAGDMKTPGKSHRVSNCSGAGFVKKTARNKLDVNV